MEQRGFFPRRFRLTVRCVVWALDEVEARREDRKSASRQESSRSLIRPGTSRRKRQAKSS
ncbi:AlpA family phage regulatory protein [Pseudacidovorax intermedius]|uniref:AlpA family phage regulatory protein n=1 Tax=Pseudacidovorax intermedius TaxID=433924 RepID=UPI0034E949A8